jgi:hypothetical protein
VLFTGRGPGSGVLLGGEPLAGRLARYSERDRDLIPGSAAGASDLYRLAEPCLVGSCRVGGLGDRAQVLDALGFPYPPPRDFPYRTREINA